MPDIHAEVHIFSCQSEGQVLQLRIVWRRAEIHQAVGKILFQRMDPFPVPERAHAPLRREHQVVIGIIDHAEKRLPVL